MEVGGEQVRFHLLSHLLVACLVQLLDLLVSYLGELPIDLRFAVEDVLNVLDLQ